MNFSIERSEQFLRDAEELFVFLAEEDIDIALRFMSSLESSSMLLGKHPIIGSPRDFTNKALHGLRSWPVKGFESYRIFYLVEEKLKRVRILRLIDSRRDLAAIFN
ncbi:MAG: type II toxin-antitoxin system RelE/ParE family toxin [Acidobacteria bacterium]|nr:type II toxin-antitoxin system RelE/ParE family toxin [Acidobacteriota bacterium]